MGVVKIQNINQLLDATIDCIKESGLEQVQISEIATKAGITTRTIHRYYPEKEMLLFDTASRYLGRFYLSFIDRYEQQDHSTMTGLEQLTDLLEQLKDYCKAEIERSGLFVDMRIYRLQQGLKSGFPQVAGSERIQQIVKECIRRGKEDGSVRKDFSTDHTDSVISYTYNGILQRILLNHSSVGDALVADDYLQMIFKDYMNFLTTYLTTK